MARPEQEGLRTIHDTSFPGAVWQEVDAFQWDPESIKRRPEVHGITFGSSLVNAVWVEKVDSKFRLDFSTVDYHALVPPPSALNEEAYKRGFAFGRPIFPPKFTQDWGSFHPDTMLPAITTSTLFDEAFDVEEVSFSRTKLSSKKQITTETVEKSLLNPSSQMRAFFLNYAELAENLLVKRQLNNSIGWYDPDKKIVTNEDGLLSNLPTDLKRANFFMREFAIHNDEMAARELSVQQIPMLYLNQIANPQAPTQADMLQSIARVVAHPAGFNLNMVEDQMRIVAGEQQFGPVVYGHYSLNKGIYGRFSNPRDSFADLVNLRQLSALISGEAPVYSLDDLEDMSPYLNDKRRETKTEQSRSFKKQEHEAKTTVIQIGAIDTLTPKAFQDVIKHTAQNDALSDEISTEIVKRLGEDRLAVKDLYLILMTPQVKTEDWQSLQTKVILWLEKHPHVSLSVANHGQHENKWQIPEPQVRSMYEGKDVFFHISQPLHVIEEEEVVTYTSREFKNIVKKQAARLAMVDVLAKVAGVDYTPTQDVVSGKEVIIIAREKPVRDEVFNPKSELNTLWTKNPEKCGMPDYLPTKEGGTKESPLFFFQASMEVGGETIISEEKSGKNKKEAEQNAADDLLKKVRHLLQPKMTQSPANSNRLLRSGLNQEVPKVAVKEDDYVTALLKFQQQAQRKHPRYSFPPQRQDSQDLCRGTLETTNGKIVFEARGDNHQEAKQKVAKLLLEAYMGVENVIVNDEQ